MNELEVLPTETQLSVFGTDAPSGIISKATIVANQLAPIVEKCRLFEMIPTKSGARKHVKVEGWTTMLAMLGVFPHSESSTRLDRADEIAYEARVVLKTLSGQVVGAGEAICSSKERNWAGRDEYAIKSMAQTRATGKAGRLSFSWIMALAGYETTPAEEMPRVEQESAPLPPEEMPPLTEKQQAYLFSLAKKKGWTEEDVKAYTLKFFGTLNPIKISSKDLDKTLNHLKTLPDAVFK